MKMNNNVGGFMNNNMNNNVEGNNNMNIFNATPSSVNTTNNSVNTVAQTSNPTVNNIPVVNESVPNATQSVSMNNTVEVKEPVVEEKTTTTTAPVASSTTSTDGNTIEIGEKYLPIGTVVMLKGGKKRAMITGFCSVPKEEPEKMYDYSGCIYPEGFISSEMVCLFNHEQIDKVYHKGLVDEEETKFKTDLKNLLNQMEKDGITVSDLEKMSTEAVNDETIVNSDSSNNTNITYTNNNASSAIPEMPN